MYHLSVAAKGNNETYTVFGRHINCTHYSLTHAFIGNSQGRNGYDQLEELWPWKRLPVLLVVLDHCDVLVEGNWGPEEGVVVFSGENLSPPSSMSCTWYICMF